VVRFTIRRIFSAILVLLAITFVSFLTQEFALRTRYGQPAPLGEVASQTFESSVNLWKRLPRGEIGFYNTPTGPFGTNRSQSLNEILGPLLARSLALLLAAMLLGGLIGGSIGLLAAASRKRGVSMLLILVSIIGVSAPSFLLGMLLQYLEITIYRRTGAQLLPVGGFGWDEHLVLPVLVLAARPVAQITRLSYVRFAAILGEDYVRTAHAKGLRSRHVWWVHIIPNAASTILTGMGTSLRFSLSSLPVVEFLFGWPGLGKTMLDMLRTSQPYAATILALTMGAIFVLINLLLDLAYRMIDPLLAESETLLCTETSWWEWLASLLEGLWSKVAPKRRQSRQIASKPGVKSRNGPGRSETQDAKEKERIAILRKARWQAWKRAIIGNPALVPGGIIGIVLLVAVIGGPSLAPHNVYTPYLKQFVDGVRVGPSLPPSTTFPLGTDQQGRDILSLLLVGARRTMVIALLAVAARLLTGGTLGFLAGWFSGSRLDRTIMGLAETLAAFPALLFAMLIVYAVGIQQGLIAFIIALSIIGWGEVMQTVRNQVMRIRPMPYIESAVATGLSQGEILGAHVLPNVWPTMVSLAFLEMGGVLMLLGDGLPTVVYYDVPEWSVMLANAWRSFRSYPWSTIFPALAFLLAILGFTLMGEGLRTITERLTLSMRKLFNRYTLAVALLIAFGARWMMESTSFYTHHAPAAMTFDASRAMSDIAYLSSESFSGRLSGSPEADRAAEWIAGEFEELGLQPAGETTGSYFQTFRTRLRNSAGPPSLLLSGPDGQEIHAHYGLDFVREGGPYDTGGIGSGDVVVAIAGPKESLSERFAAVEYGISIEEIRRQNRIFLQVPGHPLLIRHVGYAGLLMISDRPLSDTRYDLFTQAEHTVSTTKPSAVVSQELGRRLLADSGRSLEELLEIGREGKEAVYLPTGWTAKLSVPSEQLENVENRNVIGYWPGEDVALDDEAIIVAAYYDGLGHPPDGALYPGANDNASGVATMLEMIRTLKEQGLKPKRTIIFAAWTCGERHQAVSYERFLEAHPGFAKAYKIVAGLEIEGVGAGTGSSAVAWHGTRARLTECVQKAARKVHTRLNTRGPGLHADADLWPSPSMDVPSLTISWEGSDDLAHTPEDTADHIDQDKIEQVGKMTTLAVMVLATDPAY